MRYFLFEDYDTNEDFIIEEESLGKAITIAKIYFADPSYTCELSEEEAEQSGLDIY